MREDRRGRRRAELEPQLLPWRGIFLTGGVAALAFVVLIVTALLLDSLNPPPVEGGEATLRFISDHTASYAAEQILWTLPNILPVLVFVALYLALPRARNLALVGTLIGASSWALFLAVPVTSRGSLVLVYLADHYADASQNDRGVYATAAEAIVAENNTPAVLGVLSTIGILLISVAMLRGPFPRLAAWAGIAAGVTGIAGEALRQTAPAFYLVYGLLLWAWLLLVGFTLIRLGSQKDEPALTP